MPECVACPAGFFRPEGKSEKDAEECKVCSQREQVCPDEGMDDVALCMSPEYRNNMNSSQKLNTMEPVPAQNRVGRVRCQCIIGFYGYSAAPSVDRVADLSDSQTLTDLRCLRCPSGVFCDKAGSEFHLLRFQQGVWQACRCPGRRTTVPLSCVLFELIAAQTTNSRAHIWFACSFGAAIHCTKPHTLGPPKWQDYAFTNQSKVRLADYGTERCIAMQVCNPMWAKLRV